MTIEWLADKLAPLNMPSSMTEFLAAAIVFAGVLLGISLATFAVRRTLIRLITSWIQQNRYRWDDPLANNRLLTKVSWIIPVSLFSIAVDTFLAPSSASYLLARKTVMAGFVIVGVVSLNALFSTINDIHRILRKQKGSTLRGYTDAGKIVSFALGAIFLISIFTGKSPWGILSVLGGLTAITMLVFKDTILGFVASVQLTSTDMVRIGDWIEMSQYGADGDVVEMSINCIRVQNWDKTVTTIPTYALVSSSFKNWRGMSESGGRRIKRAINLDISSIGFCSNDQLKQYGKYHLISDYIERTQQDIDEYNKKHNIDPSCPVNGRRQTNIGVFRAYISAYLKNNPILNERMTFLVRQLAPTDRGLPLEVYVFSKDQAWANYEAIQADIFDHLIAAAPEFGLRLFQHPTGHDVQNATGYLISPSA